MENERRPTTPAAFEATYNALLDAYYSADARVDEPDARTAPTDRTQRMLELQSDMAHLCAANGDWRRAIGHFESILQRIREPKETAEPRSATEALPGDETDAETPAPKRDTIAPTLRAVLPELEAHTLANLGAIHHRAGDLKSAMTHVLCARTLLRELPDAGDERRDARHRLDAVLTADYAALLQAQGAPDDAMAAAEAAQRLTGAASPTEDATTATARLLATDVLVSSHRAKAESDKARELSTATAALLSSVSPQSDPRIVARAHNNTGLESFARGDFAMALTHFLAAYRVVLTTAPLDAKLQGTVRYHIGRTLAELGTTTTLPDATERIDALACLTQEETIPDPLATVLAHASRGELASDAGDFGAAAVQFTTALDALERLGANAPSQSDVVKIQGAIESGLGNALLADGRVDDAEAAHQRDLELALDSEDIHAQLRALRNLAVLYDQTQRYAEAATLWHEAIEIATVLASPRDRMVAYGGLGATLHALSIVDAGKNEYHELLSDHAHQPRALFLKQRALALELQDAEAHARAQRHIVGTYEWQPQAEELEHRLEECDAFVRVSEELGDAQFRADAYRSLANAINAQLARLAERSHRFADAIHVLTVKRNAVLQKLREASSQKPDLTRRRRAHATHVDVIARPLL